MNDSVTISLSEYRELVRSKANADILLALIHRKRNEYFGLTRDEVELIDEMFCADKHVLTPVQIKEGEI